MNANDEARARLQMRIASLLRRSIILRDAVIREPWDDGREITEALVTGFVLGISVEELIILHKAICLDYGVPKSDLKGEAVKAVLLLELGWKAD